jgi:hypothetical protein
MNIFEQAVRTQLRFDFSGQISIEQLYNARRTATFKETLISYEEQLQNQVDSFGKSSRRNSAEKTKEQKLVELRLAVVSFLLDEIEAETKIAKEKAEIAERKQELLALKAQKQAEQRASLSLEEIEAQLAAL